MKRFGGGYDSMPNKRAKAANEEIRILIRSKSAGSIIGKGGQNISKLRSDYKATITVPDCPGPERILTISADEDSILNIISEVIPLLEEKHRGSSGGDIESTELRVLIHQSQVGAVIGKGGSRIKELRDETGATVKIFSACCPNSTDRVMQVSGPPDVCVTCLRKIIELLQDSNIKGPYEPYDPLNFDEAFSAEYGGYGEGGMQGGYGGQGPWMGGSPVGYGRMGRGGMNGGSPFSSRSRGFGPGRGGMDDGFGMGRSPPGRFGRDDGYNGGSWSRGKSEFKLSFTDENEEESESQVSIPQSLAGAIIGKGGNRIRNIRSESGAKITIGEPGPGSTDRVVVITGTPQSIQMAQYLLQQSVREHGSRY